MQAATVPIPNAARLAHWEKKYPSLTEEVRPTVTTDAAAFYLGRKPQTLRGWACHEDGPIRPMRVHGRLAWPTDGIRRLLGLL